MTGMPEVQTKHICTYFDYNFLPRGLALYNSIKKFHSDFILYALAFDNETYDFLINLNYENLKPVSFETYNNFFNTNQEKYDDRKQYFFSATPNFCLYIFEKYESVDLLLYLDADVYVFNSLDNLYEEVDGASIAFCSHRFHPVFELLSKNYGRYNVGVNFFRRSEIGIRCLSEWKKECDEWYPDKPGYALKFFSDQIFLDDWPARYQEIKIINNIGVNTAPWNIANYTFSIKNDLYSINQDPLIIYHFSSLIKIDSALWNGNTIFFFGSIKGALLHMYIKYISEIESFKLNNSKISTITHKNSPLKNIFYFFMRFILNEKIKIGP
jgi:hypothetical protein